MSVVVTIEGLEELEVAWRRADGVVSLGARRGVRMAVEEGAKEARERHTFKNHSPDGLEKAIVGRLLSSDDREQRGEIRAGKFYASWVEEGRVAVTAKNAKALRFEINGQIVFRKSVKASVAKPFMGIAYFKAERVLVREIEIGVAQAQAILDR